MLNNLTLYRRRTLKLIHLLATSWFVLCVAYLLVMALRQAGVNWWVIFSVSGHSGLMVFLLVSLYLFAVFRGVGRAQDIQLEHPLTTTEYYIAFYMLAPFLGGLAGCIGMLGADRLSYYPVGMALGTLATTFLVWVIVDPAAGLAEMLLPASRRHRFERAAAARVLRKERQKRREDLIEQVLARDQADRLNWQRTLKPDAERLVALVAAEGRDLEVRRRQAVDIGAAAWSSGGLGCMQYLYEMTVKMCREKNINRPVAEYIRFWWDGIGSWRIS